MPRYISKSVFISGEVPSDIKSKLIPYNSRNLHIKKITEKLKNKKNIKIIKTYDLFCQNNECKYIKDSNLFYIDGNHLSKFGAEILASEIFNNLNMRAQTSNP